MFCEHCGSHLSGEPKFCGACGKPVQSASANASARPITPLGAATGPSFSLVIAAVLCFVWAAIMGAVVCAQMTLGTVLQSNRDVQVLAIWNGLVAVAYVFIGYGVLKRFRNAFEWAVGSNALNAAVGLYQLFAMHAYATIVFLPIEIAIVVILVVNRGGFVDPHLAQGIGRRGPGRTVNGGVQCPVCGLISPTSATVCDCGFQFEGTLHGTGRAVQGGVICPACGLINPESASLCDCGFRFDRAVETAP